MIGTQRGALPTTGQLLRECKGRVILTGMGKSGHVGRKMAATLAAARQVYPDRRLVALFQPHLFTRTRDFSEAFGEALAVADAVFLAEIYPAREQPIAGVTSDLIASAMARAGRPPDTPRSPR